MKRTQDELLRSPTVQRLRDHLLTDGPRSVRPGGAGLAGLANPLTEAVLERVAPIGELLLLMMLTDGSADRDEMDTLVGALKTITDGVLSSADVESLLVDLASVVEREGPQQRAEQVAAQLSGDREAAEAAYLLAAVIAAADGEVDERERALLDEVGDLLGIPHGRRRDILGLAPGS